MQPDSNRACCAHREVVYDTVPMGDNTVRDRWACKLCATEFRPEGNLRYPFVSPSRLPRPSEEDDPEKEVYDELVAMISEQREWIDRAVASCAKKNCSSIESRLRDAEDRAEKAEFSARQFCGAHIGNQFDECPRCWGERQGEKAQAFNARIKEMEKDLEFAHEQEDRLRRERNQVRDRLERAIHGERS